jgi:ribose-phosphate pyrophosphokinase
VDALRNQGAARTIVACTHAVFSGAAIRRMDEADHVVQVIYTDTINTCERIKSPKFKCISVAGLLGEAIDRIHRGASVSELFVPYM